MNTDLNCLSHWFPRIDCAGLPVPRTQIVTIPDEMREALMRPLDGEPFGDEVKPFFDTLRSAVSLIGTPCFLRTGQTSGKHNWKNTCYLTDADALENHVLSLIEYSELCGMFGLPWNVWCVRELLPTMPLMAADRYGDMPVCCEFRFFVEDDKVVCCHPYWPLESLVDGMSQCPADLRLRYQALKRLPGGLMDESDVDLADIASKAGAAVGGAWSVDILQTKRGWYVTDMAVASDSWHWPDCEHAVKFQRSAA